LGIEEEEFCRGHPIYSRKAAQKDIVKWYYVSIIGSGERRDLVVEAL